MATLAIESNGRLEKTAVYLNGEQIGGIRELFLNLDENGAFDAIISYEGTDKQIYTRGIFEAFPPKIKVVEPTFTDDEARSLQMISIDSDGDIANTLLYLNDEPLEGVIALFIHIKTDKSNKSGITSIFKGKEPVAAESFKAEITYRNEDDTTETENIF